MAKNVTRENRCCGTVWNFYDFSVTQILREIILGEWYDCEVNEETFKADK